MRLYDLYKLAKETGLPVLGMDGLPFNSWDTPYHDSKESHRAVYDPSLLKVEELDLIKFYETCVYDPCHSAKFEGEAKIVTNEDNVRWIGIPLHNPEGEVLIFS